MGKVGVAELLIMAPMALLFVVAPIAIIVLLVVLICKKGKKPSETNQMVYSNFQQKAVPEDDALKNPPVQPPTNTERLVEIKDLLDKGLITEEEYNSKKADILSTI